MAIACHLLGVECDWTEGGLFTRARSISPDFESGADPKLLELLWNIQHSGTHGSYTRLVEGEVDIILVAREPSVDELAAAARAGVDFEVHPVARDAFVFLRHRDNPVDSLGLEQIREIYTGAIEDWSELGGQSLPLSAYQRDPNSGSQELMKSLVMLGAPMVDAPNMIMMGMMGPINAIASDPGGLGYSVYFYAKHIFPQEEVELLAIEGVEPNAGTISDGSYPLATEVFAVLLSGHSSAAAREWLRWVMSDEGQVVVAESGYVALN
jgi:phosphate transport system substrate-binding protein